MSCDMVPIYLDSHSMLCSGQQVRLKNGQLFRITSVTYELVKQSETSISAGEARTDSVIASVLSEYSSDEVVSRPRASESSDNNFVQGIETSVREKSDLHCDGVKVQCPGRGLSRPEQARCASCESKNRPSENILTQTRAKIQKMRGSKPAAPARLDKKKLREWLPFMVCYLHKACTKNVMVLLDTGAKKCIMSESLATELGFAEPDCECGREYVIGIGNEHILSLGLFQASLWLDRNLSEIREVQLHVIPNEAMPSGLQICLSRDVCEQAELLEMGPRSDPKYQGDDCTIENSA